MPKNLRRDSESREKIKTSARRSSIDSDSLDARMSQRIEERNALENKERDKEEKPAVRVQENQPFVPKREEPSPAIQTNTNTNTLSEEWACEHCTFINEAKERVCVVCYKTKASALPVTPIPETTPTSFIAGLEKKMSTLKVSNSEESGDSGSTKNKGRIRRKISFSFGTKLAK